MDNLLAQLTELLGVRAAASSEGVAFGRTVTLLPADYRSCMGRKGPYIKSGDNLLSPMMAELLAEKHLRHALALYAAVDHHRASQTEDFIEAARRHV